MLEPSLLASLKSSSETLPHADLNRRKRRQQRICLRFLRLLLFKSVFLFVLLGNALPYGSLIKNRLWPQSPRCSKGVVASRNFLGTNFPSSFSNPRKSDSDSFGAVGSDECLSYEDDRKMPGLDLREVLSGNNAVVSGNKSRPHTVWTANSSER